MLAFCCCLAIVLLRPLFAHAVVVADVVVSAVVASGCDLCMLSCLTCVSAGVSLLACERQGHIVQACWRKTPAGIGAFMGDMSRMR